MEKDSINLEDYKLLLKTQRQAFKRQLKKVEDESPLVAHAYKWQVAMLAKVQAENRIPFIAEEAALSAVIGNEKFIPPPTLLICLKEYFDCLKAGGQYCDHNYKRCSKSKPY